MLTRSKAQRAAAQGQPESPPFDDPVLEELRLRTQRHRADGNTEALADDQIKLLNAVHQERQQKLKINRAKDAKLLELTAPEHYAVTITGCEQNGRVTAEVAGLGHSRVHVAVHPDIDPATIQIGAMGLVTRERNCLLKVTSPSGSWRDIAPFEHYLGESGRIVLNDRESSVAVTLAQGLRDAQFNKGDLIGFDREVGIAYEKVESPPGDHLFDEDVTDDFSILGGLDDQIEQIKHYIDFRVKHPEMAAKYKHKDRYGILLHGAPGNGKTCIARCAAGYMRQLYPDQPCRFMHVAGSDDYSMWFGKSEENINTRFDAVAEAAKDGKVLVFWDEIDAIAKSRGSDHGSGAPDRVLNTLFTRIDGIVQLSNVVLMFATNRADILDAGFFRPGRTDVKIEIPAPNRRAAAAILQRYVGRGQPLAGGADAQALVTPLLSRLFAPNGQYAQVASVKLNDGRVLPVPGRALLSGAMLENVVEAASQTAAVREVETGEEGLNGEDLAAALESEMIGATSALSAANVKNYVRTIPQDAHPIAVEQQLIA
mgnify:CR=1 FL=1